MGYSLSEVVGLESESLQKAPQGPSQKIQHQTGKMKPGPQDEGGLGNYSALNAGESVDYSL